MIEANPVYIVLSVLYTSSLAICATISVVCCVIMQYAYIDMWSTKSLMENRK